MMQQPGWTDRSSSRATVLQEWRGGVDEHQGGLHQQRRAHIGQEGR